MIPSRTSVYRLISSGLKRQVQRGHNEDVWGQNIINGVLNKINQNLIDPLKKALTFVFGIKFRD
jgi:hypothetical protein